ncbi:hypothetical protein L3X38_010481 [Prunus dulcis]|uniref:Uncharacterized protein n=1 Tax=Prunus dulcis TaxID=3755 RepID=A0AAD4ZEH1_PRUDU|nr:hypothetical protein L3X38_010481 [Prunus dulcis]
MAGTPTLLGWKVPTWAGLDASGQNCNFFSLNEAELAILDDQAINYSNYTIRVVDANLHKGNCSSVPYYSLSSYNFSYEDPYQVRQLRGKRRDKSHLDLSKPIIFLTCETPVNTPLYADTAPCIGAVSSSTSNGQSYASVGRLSASDLREFCRIELMVMISSQRTKNISYIDIHNEMIYGFELSWVQESIKRGRSRRVTKEIEAGLLATSTVIPTKLIANAMI